MAKAYVFGASKPLSTEKINPVCVIEEFDEGAKELHIQEGGYDIVAHEGGNIYIFLARSGNVNSGVDNVSTWLSIYRNAKAAKKAEIPVHASFMTPTNRLVQRDRDGSYMLEWRPEFFNGMDNKKGFNFEGNVPPLNERPVSIAELLSALPERWVHGDSDIGSRRLDALTANYMSASLIREIQKNVIPEINKAAIQDCDAAADANANLNALSTWVQACVQGSGVSTVSKQLFGDTHTVKPNSADRTLFSRYTYIPEEETLLFRGDKETYEIPFFGGAYKPSSDAIEEMRADFDSKLTKMLKAADRVIDSYYAKVSAGIYESETLEDNLENVLPSILQSKARLGIDRYKHDKDSPWSVGKAYLMMYWTNDHEPYNFYIHGLSLITKYASKMATVAEPYSNDNPKAHHYVPIHEDAEYNPIFTPSIQDSSLAKWCTLHTYTTLDAMFLGAWLYKCVKKGSGGRQVLWLVNPGNCGTSTFVNYIYRSVDGSGTLYTRDETESGFFGQSIMGKKICAFVDIHSRPMNLLRNILNFTEAEVLTTNVKNRNFATFTARGLKVMVATNEKLSFDEELAWATSRVFPLQVKRANGQSIAMGDVIQRLLNTQEANLKWAAECYKHLEYYGYISGNDFTRVGASEYESRVQSGIKVNPPEYDTTEDQSREQANANMEAVDDRFINFYAREVKEDLERLRRRAWDAVKDKLPKVLGVTCVNGAILADCLMAHDAMCSNGYDALEGFFEGVQKNGRENAIKEAQAILSLVKEPTWAKRRVVEQSRKELKDLMPINTRFYAFK